MPVGTPPGTIISLADVISPVVWSDFVQERFPTRLILGQFAESDDTLVGQPGDTITFPEWTNLGPAQELNETTEIITDKFTTSTKVATVQEIGKGVAITDRAVITAMGDPQARGVQEIARVVAEKIDTDLALVLKKRTGDGVTLRTGLTAEGNPFSVGTHGTTGTGTRLSWELLFEGMTAFPDEVTPGDLQALITNTAGVRFLARMPEFREEFATNGMVGRVSGVPLIRSDRSGDAGRIYLILQSPLQLMYKRRPITEYERQASWRRTNVYTSVHYGVRRGDARLITIVNFDTTLLPDRVLT
jgi:hypothetical protein